MNHFLAQSGNEEAGFLNEADSHHALRVLRLKMGDTISISYGDGKVYRAEINQEHKKAIGFRILDLRREQIRPKLSIAIAPTKSNDRFEWFLEKATELGVHRIIPIICEHSERRIYKQDRGNRIIEAAFKQSHKGYFPLLEEAQDFKKFLQEEKTAARYIASLNEGPKVKLTDINYGEESIVIIGPEGDFSSTEIGLAEQTGVQHLDLGAEVLRTETAGMQVCGIWNYEAQRPKY